MEQANTFDLTQPPVLSQNKPPQKQGQEVKTLTVSMAPKKEQRSQGQSQKLPALQSQSRDALNSKSSKSVPKPNKIDVLRSTLDLAQIQQKQQSKKNDRKQQGFNQQHQQQEEQVEKPTYLLKEVYQKKIEEQINQIYKDKEDQAHIIYELKSLEKKRNIQKQLMTKEQQLNQEKQEHDQLIYDIKQKKQKLKGLKQQINDLGVTFAKEEDINDLELKSEELQRLTQSLGEINHETSILSNMYGQRRLQLLQVQKQCQECFDKIQVERQRFSVQMQQNSSCQKRLTVYSKMLDKYNVPTSSNHQMWTSLWKSNFDLNMQNILSDELSLFEDKKAFNEVINNQKQIEEKKKQKEQEKLRKQQEDDRREKEKANQQIKQEQKNVENLLKEKDKIFKKLCKVTRVTELDKIIPLKNELDAGNNQLNQIKQFVQQQIEEHQEIIEEQKQTIKVLQYEKNDIEEVTQQKLDGLERDLMKEFDIVQDREKQVKKLEKSIDEVSVAMSRIMFQLEGKGSKLKNIEIPRDKLISTASVVSLRLERMLTVLSKKKDFLNEESVNTNPKYIEAPEFIGINQKEQKQKYAEMEGKDYIDNDKINYDENASLDDVEKDYVDYIEEERKNMRLKGSTDEQQEKEKQEKNQKKDGKK